MKRFDSNLNNITDEISLYNSSFTLSGVKSFSNRFKKKEKKRFIFFSKLINSGNFYSLFISRNLKQ